MDTTDNLKFLIPGEDDTGATALYLEALARQFDTKAQQYREAFNDFVKPPVIVTQSQSSDTALPNILDDQHLFSDLWAYSGGSVVYSNLPAGLGFSDGDFPVPGWWLFGAYRVSSTINGAANNQPTLLALYAESPDAKPGQDTVLHRVDKALYESTTSGEHWEIFTTVYVPPGIRVYANLTAQHSMVGITRTFQAGAVGVRLYLGSGDTAQKAGF